MELRLEDALLLLNDWVGQHVTALVVIRDGAPRDQPPPSGGRGRGWHVVLGGEEVLGRPDAQTDFKRQLSLGTYTLGDARLKLLLDGLPCERIVVRQEDGQPPHMVAFYLSGSMVVLLLERMPDS